MRIRCTVCNITKAGIRAIYNKDHCLDKSGDGIKSFESPGYSICGQRTSYKKIRVMLILQKKEKIL